jgi:hypothetical protein
MSGNKPTDIFTQEETTPTQASREEYQLPHWLFQHQDLIHDLEGANLVDQRALTNMLNHIHFTDGYVLVHLRHPKHEQSILVRARPEPCLGKEITCSWFDERTSNLQLKTYQFLNIIIDDGSSMILVPALLQERNEDGLTVQLPLTSYVVGQRQARRYPCHEVVVELIQSGYQARGELLDFSPVGFRISIDTRSSDSLHWFNSDALVNINLRHGEKVLFSGLCRCIRERSGTADKEIVAAPVDQKITRFKRKRMRNPRQRLIPSPTLIFNHPLLKKRVQIEVSDISTSGFSVYEKPDEGVLLQGMIIPEVIIDFAGALRMKCSAQVIYRSEEKGKGVRCGLSILDMDINTYSRLTHLLTSALDPHASIASEIDMEALWEFFFRTGFIYPSKYRLIQRHREDFKRTYKKIYEESPEIEKHFTYQRNGMIYGHISMVRAYERAWLIHHHAARSMDNRRAGFVVLKQIIHYLNDMHRLPSAKMDYVISYFRPENVFPDRVFGDFARVLKNPRGCSVDLFSYLPYTSLSLGTKLPEGWLLRESSTLDLWELKRFYSHRSGGLLLDAFGLEQRDSADESIEQVYNRLGFFRKLATYSLSHRGDLNAVLIVNQSDLGINLSELLNGITILITNPEDLPWNVLSTAIGQLTGVYSMERVPVLFCPSDYVKNQRVPYEKHYQLWILNVQYGNEYMEYMQKRFRMIYR